MNRKFSAIWYRNVSWEEDMTPMMMDFGEYNKIRFDQKPHHFSENVLDMKISRSFKCDELIGLWEKIIQSREKFAMFEMLEITPTYDRSKGYDYEKEKLKWNEGSIEQILAPDEIFPVDRKQNPDDFLNQMMIVQKFVKQFIKEHENGYNQGE